MNAVQINEFIIIPKNVIIEHNLGKKIMQWPKRSTFSLFVWCMENVKAFYKNFYESTSLKINKGTYKEGTVVLNNLNSSIILAPLA